LLKEAERIWEASRVPSQSRERNVGLLWNRVSEETRKMLGSTGAENREVGDPRDQDCESAFLESTLKENLWARTRQSSTWTVGVGFFGFSVLVALLLLYASGKGWSAEYGT